MHDLKTLGGKWTGICESIKESHYSVTPLKLMLAHRTFNPEMNFHFILDQGWENLTRAVQREPLYLTSSWLLAFQTPSEARIGVIQLATYMVYAGIHVKDAPLMLLNIVA